MWRESPLPHPSASSYLSVTYQDCSLEIITPKGSYFHIPTDIESKLLRVVGIVWEEIDLLFFTEALKDFNQIFCFHNFLF